MPEIKTIITIYTHNGHTFQFENAQNIFTMNNSVAFEYVGVRSGKVSKAEFHNVAGYTVREEIK